MKLLSRHRKATAGNFRGGVSLSDKEQLGIDSEVIQSIPPTKPGSPKALQWKGGLGIIKDSQKRDVPTASGYPILACSQHWGGKQEREGSGSQAAVRRRMLHSNKAFHTEAD